MFPFHLLLFFLLCSASASGQQAEFFFAAPFHKFERVREGIELKHNFVFTNSGKAPLFITDYKVACVCTRVTFPLKPIKPGATDTIKVVFDTKAKQGYQDRTISIYSNARNNPVNLRFKVFVQKKK